MRLRKEIVASVTAKLPDFSPEKVDHMVSALYSLYQVRSLAEMSIDEFVRELAGAMLGNCSSPYDC